MQPLSQCDRDHVEQLLTDPECDWFGALLIRLIAKADGFNRRRLARVYPAHVQAYEAWYEGPYHFSSAPSPPAESSPEDSP